jgi:Rrf2 family protein
MTSVMRQRKARKQSSTSSPGGENTGANGESPRVSLLSQTTEYALRALAHISLLPKGESITAVELAETTKVPVYYLSKVLRRLVEAGLLVSQKGHYGGFYLARPARSIRFADILNAVQQQPSSNRCAFGWGACDAGHPCPLHPAWSRLNALFTQWTESTTLADVGGLEASDMRRKS